MSNQIFFVGVMHYIGKRKSNYQKTLVYGLINEGLSILFFINYNISQNFEYDDFELSY